MMVHVRNFVEYAQVGDCLLLAESGLSFWGKSIGLNDRF